MPKVGKQTAKPTLRKRVAAKASPWDRIEPVSLREGGLKISLYGKSGTGKTVLACTFPKPLLIVQFEEGTKSVHNVKGVERTGVIKDMEDVVAISEGLAEGRPSRSGKPFKSVVVDTATGVQDGYLRNILGLEKLPEQSSWGLATREQWGQCTIQTKECLRSFLDLADGELMMNVVIIAQERNFNDESASDILFPTVGSALSPSVKGWLDPACDYIMNTFIRQGKKKVTKKIGKKEIVTTVNTGKVEYCIRTAPDPVYTTKFRVPKGSILPDVIVDPDYDKIVKLIQGVV